MTITEEQLNSFCVNESEKRDIRDLLEKVNKAKTIEEKKDLIIKNGAELGDLAIKSLKIVL